MSRAVPQKTFGKASPHAPTIWLPLQFMLAGIVAVFAAFILIAIRPEILATYHYNQYVVSVTHLFVLGWIGAVVMGAMYQLVPIALETHLHSENLARIHFWVHVVAVGGMVCTFWKWDMKQAGHYGSLLTIGVILFVYNLVRTLRTIPRWNVIAAGIAASLFWLSFGVLAGLYVVAAKCWSFSPFSPIAQMHAHAHLGIVGFFLQLVVAVSYKLIPMFTLSEIQNQRRAWAALILLNVGLLGAFVGILLQLSWKGVFTGVTIAGLAVYAIEMLAVLRARKRKVLDLGVKYFVTAIALLAPVVILAAILSWPTLPMTQLTAQLENLYGFVALGGVLTLGIIGMLYKIISFLVWYGSYSREIGKSKTPSLTDLYSSKLQVMGYWIFLVALLVTSIGIIRGSETIVRAGAIVFCIMLGCFVVNTVKMLSHLFAPRLEPLSMRAVVGGAV